MADDLTDLDEAVRRHDPDRWLASRFIADAQARADVIALYAFHHEIARVAGAVSNPLMGEIRLTWWAEALDEICDGRPVRRHPVTLALKGAIARHALPRDLFDRLIEARYPELDGKPIDPEEAEAPLIELAARVLGAGAHQGFASAAQGDHALANRQFKDLPSVAFPAVAHLALRRIPGASSFRRRLAITWAVITGRI